MSDEQLKQAEHVGEMKALWGEQQRMNIEIRSMINNFEKRLTSVEKRVIIFTTIAATLGSILGPAIMKLFA